MQNYTKIAGTDKIQDSRATINNNTDTLLSNSSGTNFPVADLLVGQLFWKTDTKDLWAYSSAGVWTKVIDWNVLPSTVSTDLTNLKNASSPLATTSVKGFVKLATTTESKGTLETVAVTPKGLHEKVASVGVRGLVTFASDEEVGFGASDKVVSAANLKLSSSQPTFDVLPYSTDQGALVSASIYSLSDGRIYGFGYEPDGALNSGEGAATTGIDHIVPSPVLIQVPNEVGTGSKLKQVFNHYVSFFLFDNGNLYSIGKTTWYGAGNGSNTPTAHTFKLILTDVKEIIFPETKYEHRFTMVRKNDNSVWGWGGSKGALGLGSTAETTIPTQISGATSDAEAVRYYYIARDDGHAYKVDHLGNVSFSGYDHQGVGGLGTVAGVRHTTWQSVGNFSPGCKVYTRTHFNGSFWEYTTLIHDIVNDLVYLAGNNSNRQLCQGTSTTNSGTFLLNAQLSELGIESFHSSGCHVWYAKFKPGANQTKVISWGYQGWGQLGDGSTVDSGTPITLTFSSKVLNIFVSNRIANFSTGVMVELEDVSGYSRLKAWGYNGYGNLGTGETRDTNLTPVDVEWRPQAPIVRVCSGSCSLDAGGFYAYTHIYLADGTAWWAGDNIHGASGIPGFTGGRRSIFSRVEMPHNR